MLPRWHIILGAVLTLLFWIFAPSTPWYYLAVLFLASFLIDFDHYVQAARKNKHLSLIKAFDYHKDVMKTEARNHKKGIRKKGDFHFLHTIEFHLLIGVLGIFFTIFFYIFIGMIFHSLLDLYDMSKRGLLYRREYFFFNWLKKRF